MALIDNIRVAALSPKTISNYESGVRSLTAKANTTIETILEHPDKYIPLFKSWFPKDTSFKVHLSFILGLFKYNASLKTSFTKQFESWSTAFKSADNNVNARYETNAPTERQRAGYVPYDEIIKKRDELPVGSIERLLLGMYTHLHPMRCEYAKVALYENEPPEKNVEPNYILLKPGKLIINHFKTRNHHDGYDLKMPKPLMDDLKESLKNRPRSWLFINNNDEPFTPVLFSSWTMRVFKRIFHKPLTVAIIRHSFINTIDFNALSVADKKEIALSMGHTVGTQDRYRLIFSTPPPNESTA